MDGNWWIDMVHTAQALRMDSEYMERFADECGEKACLNGGKADPDPRFLAAMFRIAETVGGKLMREAERLREEYPEVYENRFGYEEETE